LVGVNYAPELTGIGPYTAELAEYIIGRVASVRVITGLPTYPSWTIPSEYRTGRRFAEVRSEVQVTRVRHYVPGKQDALRRGAYEMSFGIHAGRVPVAPVSLIVGITPALGGAVAAARLARRHRVPFVAVVQDLMGRAAGQSGIVGGRSVAGLASGLEARTLLRADAVVVVSDAFRSTLDDYGLDPARVYTIQNWSRATEPVGDRVATRARLGWPRGTTIALHTGNMGLKQDLANVVQAARLSVAESNVRWVLMGEGSQRTALATLAAGLPNLEFLPLCDWADYPAVLDAADVLLLNERSGVAEMCLPSKLTSYFRSGRPVAAAVDPTGAAAGELARAGAPAPVPPADPTALLRLVGELAASPRSCHAHGQAQKAYAERELGGAAAMRAYESVLSAVVGETPVVR
jgi:glycosyltransferase involved in cell wall biosynthesis